MARGHRRTNRTWRTRPPSSKHSGGWSKSVKRPQPEPNARPAGPIHEVNVSHDDSIVTWWWTIARGGRCGKCGNDVAKGDTIAFQPSGREIRCRVCVEYEGLTPRESKAFKAAKAA
jgi:hypothetical protein